MKVFYETHTPNQCLTFKVPIYTIIPKRLKSPGIALMMKAASTSETSVNFYETTRRYNPEDSHLRTHRRENLKSYEVAYWSDDEFHNIRFLFIELLLL
jgi:hypothetical protein